MAHIATRRKCKQHNVEHLKFGIISAPNIDQLPMRLLCGKVLSNEAMRTSRLYDHLKMMHPDEINQNLSYFENLRN